MLFLRWTIWLRGAVAITDSAGPESKQLLQQSRRSRCRFQYSPPPLARRIAEPRGCRGFGRAVTADDKQKTAVAQAAQQGRNEGSQDGL
jgi:hypothetical protein